MGRDTFNGANPVVCLRFLSVFKKKLDNEGILESVSLDSGQTSCPESPSICLTLNQKKVMQTSVDSKPGVMP